jgi:hypothetical protein
MVVTKELIYNSVPFRPVHHCHALTTAMEGAFVLTAHAFVCQSGKEQIVMKQIVCQLAAMAMESVAMASASVIRGGKEWTALSLTVLFLIAMVMVSALMALVYVIQDGKEARVIQ